VYLAYDQLHDNKKVALKVRVGAAAAAPAPTFSSYVGARALYQAISARIAAASLAHCLDHQHALMPVQACSRFLAAAAFSASIAAAAPAAPACR
jgi:hypothetical protein